MGGRGDLAGYGSRVGATLLDSLVIFTIAVILLAVAGGEREELQLYAVAGSLAASFVYAPLLLCRSGARNGQTLGKQAVGIRVVREDAAPIEAGTALLREAVGKGVLGVVPLFTLVDFLFPLGDARRQAIHDKMATTFVVRADAVPDLDAPPAPPETGGFRPPASAPPGDWAPPKPHFGKGEDPFGN